MKAPISHVLQMIYTVNGEIKEEVVQCAVKSSSYSQVRLKAKATAIEIKVGGGILANGSLLLSVRENRKPWVWVSSRTTFPEPG